MAEKRGLAAASPPEICPPRKLLKKSIKSAEKTLDTLFKKMLDKGSPDMVSGLLFAILLAKARKEKEEKEEDLENE